VLNRLFPTPFQEFSSHAEDQNQIAMSSGKAKPWEDVFLSFAETVLLQLPEILLKKPKKAA
jgi:hypothetical protein